MKKVGILTFHKSINYGSVLQAWALSRVLHNYDVSIINYEPIVYKKIYGVFSFSRGPKHNVNRLINYTAIKNQIRNFADFRQEYMTLTQKCTANDVSINSFKQYDAVITGSDQIWNVHAEDSDDVFFLPYKLNAKKIAYACSINTTDFTEKRCDENLKKYMLDYDFISIREQSGAKKVAKFLNNKKSIYTVLDPTLLNSKENFDTITNERIVNEPYIFLYNVWSGLVAVEAAEKISKLTGLPVYTALTDTRIKQIIRIEKAGIIIEKKHTSPQDFLSLIKYADLVITESFHGTAFSLIFEKNFVCINSKDNNGKLKNDERIINILGITGLMNRYISVDDIETFDFNENIDYKIVTSKRMKEAARSKELLIGAIEGTVKS